MSEIIIVSDNRSDRPRFQSQGVFKHLSQPWLCWIVELPAETFNPDQYKGECIIDDVLRNVVSVERKAHMPPWHKGEIVALAVKL
jgi:hypothetical protein